MDLFFPKIGARALAEDGPAPPPVSTEESLPAEPAPPVSPSRRPTWRVEEESPESPTPGEAADRVAAASADDDTEQLHLAARRKLNAVAVASEGCHRIRARALKALEDAAGAIVATEDAIDTAAAIRARGESEPDAATDALRWRLAVESAGDGTGSAAPAAPPLGPSPDEASVNTRLVARLRTAEERAAAAEARAAGLASTLEEMQQELVMLKIAQAERAYLEQAQGARVTVPLLLPESAGAADAAADGGGKGSPLRRAATAFM